ncbi:hypothetical protein MED92_00735 [Neptuniibacter caesariensis]|uniref:Uncharacterized protein n=1 Tax=Neptuniibacter caesariensis TaxID=207954 RepID=A0A7U8GRA8_NEPCE|nr:hypothetical protein MED92_00735 [Neptuniibacter caesariensis]
MVQSVQWVTHVNPLKQQKFDIVFSDNGVWLAGRAFVLSGNSFNQAICKLTF